VPPHRLAGETPRLDYGVFFFLAAFFIGVLVLVLALLVAFAKQSAIAADW
jgi:hypothetical protein